MADDSRTREALSRKYSDDIIMVLPLQNHEVAVFNSARELCGFTSVLPSWVEIRRIWYPPVPVPAPGKPDVDLNDLELI